VQPCLPECAAAGRNAGATTVLERGIKYAAEDRVGTAVMTQMFGAVGGLLMAAAIHDFRLRLQQRPDSLRRARLLRHGERWPVFPQASPNLHPTYKTPAVSLMVQMVWACVLCVSGSYGQLLDYIIFAVLVFYILTIVGLFVLRRKHPDAERPYRAVGYPVLPAVIL
jgi:basic amino acid/polyamine antiporter, APA family